MGPSMSTLWRYLPRGNTLDDVAWHRRHRIVLVVLMLHLPALFVFGLALGHPVTLCAEVVTVPFLCAILGYAVKRRRLASIFTTAGLTCCSVALVGFSHGSIEAHFHFFIIIGFIALYQDWVPFLWNVVFTLLSHGLGSLLVPDMIFNHHAGQHEPWLWSGIHALAVAFACLGVVLFWRVSEDDQQRASAAKRRADSEAERRRFTSDLLVNLARRNQKMLYRQLEIINQLEHKESDPDTLAELFRLEHLATRVRRNAENLLVLSGEGSSRVWSVPVPLREVVRAAIAETEDLDRVGFQVDEHLAIAGHCVADLTHLLAELAENAVRFSPPGSTVSIAQRPYPQLPGAQLLTIEDWGVGMPPSALNAANRLLSDAPEVDLSESRQLGFHVVARLAKRHGLRVSLTPTPGCGVTAAVVLPAELFGTPAETPGTVGTGAAASAAGARAIGESGSAARSALVPAGVSAGPVSMRAPSSLRAVSMRAPSSPRVEPTATPLPARNGRAARGVEKAGTARAVEPWPVERGGRWDGWWKTADDEPVEPVPGEIVPAPEPVAAPATVAAPAAPAAQVAPRAQVAPAASASPAGSTSGEAGDGEAREGKLNRRRPQTHLAPELRHPVPRPRSEHDALAQSPPPPADPSALSRYQASRHAAQAAAQGQDGDGEQRR